MTTKERTGAHTPRRRGQDASGKAVPAANGSAVPPAGTPAHCLCGCGAEVTREFRPGHDARYKSQLVKAAIGGDEAAAAIIEQRGWGAFLEKGRNTTANRAERDRRRELRTNGVAGGFESNGSLLETMKAARLVLIERGRYGRAAGERRIAISADNCRDIAEGVFDFDNHPGDGALPPLHQDQPKRKATVR